MATWEANGWPARVVTTGGITGLEGIKGLEGIEKPFEKPIEGTSGSAPHASLASFKEREG